MVLLSEEPAFGPWGAVSLQAFKQSLQRDLSARSDRPSVIAVDGRSGNGKSTLAGILHELFPGSVVVHIDDIPSSGNWFVNAEGSVHPSLFDWTERLCKNVLEPAREGLEVRYRPRAWDDWGRKMGSAIEVLSGCSMLILEGVGAARRELTHLIDVVIWLQADVARAQARGIARDGGGSGARALWQTWNDQEFPFLAEQRPWERANYVICGAPDIEYNPASEIVMADRGLKT